MALVELDDELVINLLSGSSDVEELWEEILNQVLQAEIEVASAGRPVRAKR